MSRLPDLGLAGKTALVTGATSGIGRAAALALGRSGVTVAVNHRPGSEGRADEVVAAIAEVGGEAFRAEADVSSERAVIGMFAEVVSRAGTIDILVNNAGIQDGAALAEMTLAQWQRVIDVNLSGQFLCAREAVREFRRRGTPSSGSRALGNIICVSSVHQAIPWACHVNYAASKGGVNLLMESMAQELAHDRIRVNAVAPGAIKTSINRSVWESRQALDELLELIPYGRIGDVGDVAQAVLWLASDVSDYVVGTTLFIDGGMTLYPSFRGGG